MRVSVHVVCTRVCGGTTIARAWPRVQPGKRAGEGSGAHDRRARTKVSAVRVHPCRDFRTMGSHVGRRVLATRAPAPYSRIPDGSVLRMLRCSAGTPLPAARHMVRRALAGILKGSAGYIKASRIARVASLTLCAAPLSLRFAEREEQRRLWTDVSV